jgi:hypothetical protein
LIPISLSSLLHRFLVPANCQNICITFLPSEMPLLECCYYTSKEHTNACS